MRTLVNPEVAVPWQTALSGGARCLRQYLTDGTPEQAEKSIALRIGAEDELPDESLLRDAVAAGLSRVDAEFDLSTTAGFFGHIIILRSCASLGLPVSWRAQFPVDYPFPALSHLPPPTAEACSHEAEVRRWQSEWRYGLFYWRKGPSFVMVKDVRPRLTMQRVILDTDVHLEVFDRLASGPVPVQTLRSVELDELVGVGIVLEHAAHAITLPYRIVEWPTPYMSI